MDGGVQVDASVPLVVQGFLAVGFLGALVGCSELGEHICGGWHTCRTSCCMVWAG